MTKKVKILIVEDHAQIADYIKEHLTEQGYLTSIEPEGDKAAFRILQEQPDLVILDIMLPGMDGGQICQTVRNDYLGKILMLTALNEIEDEITGFNLGADDYMSKPVKLDLLTARIEALLRRQQGVIPPTQLNFGKLAIDLATHIVTLDNNEIDLKPTEFQLLALLAKNCGHTLNRDNISQALSGKPYDGVDRSIDLRISYLRKKLNDNPNKPYRIKTVHGKGYVFVSTAWDS